ncbi:unnamed protein product [Eruca vesicaria subsp. sativa]|uniref:Uncharacterized protein n=1 Tax=Eruca vesicaria subsp. sativa TaxID=29727 RepID=A0ABC8LX06_ERUVS|nr:unnamed protein product [Eruca vesicaria subsp. sativa]
MRVRTDDIFLKLLTGAILAKDNKARGEIKVVNFYLLKEEIDHEVSKGTIYGKDRAALMGKIAREADNMLKDFFDGKEPNKRTNPNEALACGAAVQGGEKLTIFLMLHS